MMRILIRLLPHPKQSLTKRKLIQLRSFQRVRQEAGGGRLAAEAARGMRGDADRELGRGWVRGGR